MSSWRIPRRTVLRGLGYSFLLPMLDAMVPKDARAQGGITPRFGAMYLNLGTYGGGFDPTKNDPSRYRRVSAWQPGGMGVWVPSATGPLTSALGPALSPLESIKQKIAIVSGLSTFTGNNFGESLNHSIASTQWLTSAWRTTAEATANNIAGPGASARNANPPDSIDQYIANALGITPGSTLALNPTGYDFSETGQGGHAGAVSYNTKLSAGGSSLLPRLADPKKAFDALFANCKSGSNAAQNAVRQARQKSVLDYVSTEISETQKRVGANDRARLDSYFQNIRDLEKRLTGTMACPAEPQASPALTGGPLDNVSRLNMMADIVALALASGTMPIATLMTGTEGDGVGYAAVGVDSISSYVGINGQKVRYRSMGLSTHIDITHQEGVLIQAIEEHIAYTQMNVTFAARLLRALDSMPTEPNGLTPLDNSIILIGSGHANSGSHDTHNLPTILAGGKAWRMKQGEHVAFPMKTDIGDLHYTIAKQFGVDGPSFNGHSGVLPGLFG